MAFSRLVKQECVLYVAAEVTATFDLSNFYEFVEDSNKLLVDPSFCSSCSAGRVFCVLTSLFVAERIR